MAHTDGIDKIVIPSTRDRVIRSRELQLEVGSVKIIEIPMEYEWPSGDPVPRDRETLVIRFTREAAEHYGISGITEASSE